MEYCVPFLPLLWSFYIVINELNVYWSISVPAMIIDELSSNDVTVQEGDVVILICNVTGVPRPDVTWYRRPAAPGKSADRESKIEPWSFIRIEHKMNSQNDPILLTCSCSPTFNSRLICNNSYNSHCKHYLSDAQYTSSRYIARGVGKKLRLIRSVRCDALPCGGREKVIN